MPMSATNAPPAAPSVHSAPDSGTEAVPFRQFLLKVHSRCNLACTYCYMYEAADQSWRQRPRSMAPATVRRASRLMAEHATEHALSEVHVVLHGGEPLLVGAEYLEDLLGTVTDALAGIATPRFSLQTNGIRLAEDPRLLPVLDRHGVRIGVSLDGTPAAHDRHRRRADGKGSYAATARALELLTEPAHRHLFAGLLCVIDPTTSPLETYEALLRFAPPRLDLLLPHGTWQAPPPGLDARISPPSAAPPPGAAACSTPYADWLCAVFDRWYGAPRRETGIRLFEEIMVLLLGGTARSEVVGLTPVDLVVVETDGAIEQADSLKVSYPGAPETGLHVLRDTFADAAAHPPSAPGSEGWAGSARSAAPAPAPACAAAACTPTDTLPGPFRSSRRPPCTATTWRYWSTTSAPGCAGTSPH